MSKFRVLKAAGRMYQGTALVVFVIGMIGVISGLIGMFQSISRGETDVEALGQVMGGIVVFVLIAAFITLSLLAAARLLSVIIEMIDYIYHLTAVAQYMMTQNDSITAMLQREHQPRRPVRKRRQVLVSRHYTSGNLRTRLRSEKAAARRQKDRQDEID